MRVVGLGALNVDHLYRVPRLLSEGEVTIQQAATEPGGSAANTVYALARLGLEAGFVGVVGDDEDGWTVLRDFTRAGVEIDRIRLKLGSPTGTTLCLVAEDGERAIYVLPGANDLLTREDVDLEYLAQADLVHLSSFAGESHLALQQEMVGELPAETRVSFAPGDLYAARGLEVLKPLLERTDVLFLNRQELRELTGKDMEEGCRRCLETGCRLVVVTMGGPAAAGDGPPLACYARDGERECRVVAAPAGEIEVVDTTGAGDAFAAGFLYGRLKGRSLEECGILGEAVARRCIAVLGARGGLPSLARLRRDFQKATGQTL